jgi:hypothetical protein
VHRHDQREKAVGKALLETDELIFRGEDVRLKIPYKSVSSIDVKTACCTSHG